MPFIELTITQTIDLLAMGPCFILMAYMLAVSRTYKAFSLLPIAYFISLTSSFLLGLKGAFPAHSDNALATLFLMLLENLAPALSYLLAIQVLTNKRPDYYHFLILLVPLVGGSSFIFAEYYSQEVCFRGTICISTSYSTAFYRVFSASLIFMLLTVFISGHLDRKLLTLLAAKHRYWLVMSFVLFNLLSLGLDLFNLSGYLEVSNYQFTQTVVRLSFIYLVFTSIIRIFSPASESVILPILPPVLPKRKLALTAAEEQIALRIKAVLEEEHAYRELGFNREQLAKKLNVKEHQLSSIINLYFKQSFSELVNQYRIEEAQKLLAETQDSVTAISFDTGFNSLTSFNRVFKDNTGLSPSDYREKFKADNIKAR